MSFSATDTIQEINESMNAMLLLHSSCQGIIEANVEPSSSPWYSTLTQELGAAEQLVVGWRQSGFLYFQQDILGEIISYGNTFSASQKSIDGLFDQLEKQFSTELKNEIVAALTKLQGPIDTMISQIGAYLAKLGEFEKNLQVPYGNMNGTISQIQAQEADIKIDIETINSQIASMKKQITADRAAIAKAKKAREKGIVETIFGVLLAPITGGASLILAGIGVATIADAEDKIHSLQSDITKDQGTIATDQNKLSDDQKQVATLHGLAMSVAIALSDMGMIDQALDTLSTSWGIFKKELDGVISKLDQATDAQEAILGKAWFDAAVLEWKTIAQQAQNLTQRNITTTRVQIG